MGFSKENSEMGILISSVGVGAGQSGAAGAGRIARSGEDLIIGKDMKATRSRRIDPASCTRINYKSSFIDWRSLEFCSFKALTSSGVMYE